MHTIMSYVDIKASCVMHLELAILASAWRVALRSNRIADLLPSRTAVQGGAKYYINDLLPGSFFISFSVLFHCFAPYPSTTHRPPAYCLPRCIRYCPHIYNL